MWVPLHKTQKLSQRWKCTYLLIWVWSSIAYFTNR